MKIYYKTTVPAWFVYSVNVFGGETATSVTKIILSFSYKTKQTRQKVGRSAILKLHKVHGIVSDLKQI